ncbi:Shikimate kinase and 3-dehydroquinate synthase, partial [human gut metagenome]
LRHVLTSPAAAQGVVALGGGAVLREENRRMLTGRLVIHLAAEPATAAAHVGDGTGRPLMRPAGSSSDDEDLLAN